MSASYQDREAIRELTARYNQAADNRELDTFAECFTPEGIFRIDNLLEVQGHDNVKAIIAAMDFPTRHITTDAIVDVRGDTATQSCSFILLARPRDENGMQILASAVHADKLIRTRDGWRFAERRAITDNDLGRQLAVISPSMAAALSA